MQLQVFYRENVLGREMAVYGDSENIWFAVNDVSEWLEYDSSSNNKLVSLVDEEEKLLGTLFRSGQNRQTWFVSEDGLYEILMQSRKPIAKEFKKNVKRILKEIRKTGSYTTPKTQAEMLLHYAEQMVKQEREMLEVKKKQLEFEQKQDLLQLEHQNIKEVLGAQYDNWRKSTNSIINKISYKTNMKQNEIRNEAYSLLENRAGCRLEQRLNNMKARCFKEKNWSQSMINKLNTLDVIQNENKLIQIFVAIVKELAIKYGI